MRATILACVLAATPLLGGTLLRPGAMPAFAAGGGEHGGGEHGGGGGGGGGIGRSGGAGDHAANAAGHAGDHVGRGAASGMQMASALGALNAVHASSTALAHAAPGSKVGQIAAYDNAMLAALAMPGDTPAQVAARNAAIAAARAQLAAATNKTLTPDVVAAVDNRLGLPTTDPTLGVTP
jgi:hypothetical protein